MILHVYIISSQLIYFMYEKPHYNTLLCNSSIKFNFNQHYSIRTGKWDIGL